MISVIEKFGSLSNYEIVSATLNFILCALFLIIIGMIYKDRLRISFPVYSKNIYCMIILVIAIMNGISGGLVFTN